MQHHRPFIYTSHRLLFREWLLIHRQHVFDAGDVLLIQFRDAPPFFPATVSARGSREGCESSPGPHAAQLPLHRFLSNEPHIPPRPALGRRTAHHGNDPLSLACVQRSLLAGSSIFVQCRLQPFLLITPCNGSHRFRSYTHIGGHLGHCLSPVRPAQDRSPTQHARRFRPLPQHPRRKSGPIKILKILNYLWSSFSRAGQLFTVSSVIASST